MATTTINPKNKTKQVDLPPYGDRNADPITDAAGAHPIETGIGAAVTGAATGMIGGAIAGPIGAVVGAVAGAIGGGYAGKGIGEAIDPTIVRGWYDEYATVRESANEKAYQFGVSASARHPGRTFADSESMLRADWMTMKPESPWADVRDDAKAGYIRTHDYRSKECNSM